MELGLFWTIVGALLAIVTTSITLIMMQNSSNKKQEAADQKIFAMLEAQDKRMDMFQKTLDTIQAFLIENSKEHSTLLERLNKK